MIGSLERLPTGWLIVVVFVATFAVAAGIYFVAIRLARGPAGAAMQGVSPGLLPPMALVFGLIVGFLVAGLWSDQSNARDAVNREASALRSTSLVAEAAFPGATAAQIDNLIAKQIHSAVTQEWPAMRDQRATLSVVPPPLAQLLHAAMTIHPGGQEQVTAQRELVTSIENALDARRQRIIISQSSVSGVKWLAVIFLAVLTLIAIACVHCENRGTAAIAIGIFSAAVAITIVLIASQARPFSGDYGIKPDALIQVAPSAAGSPAPSG